MSILIDLSAVLSLVTIISIYREGGILKRLRATPLRPQTILTAHVLVKLLLTAVTLILLMLAGKRYYPVGVDAPVLSFAIALLISTWSILSIGFVIASIVPTARFAQPIGAAILYPMIGLSGLFVPIDGASAGAADRRPGAAAHLRGVAAAGHLERANRWSAHVGDVAALVVVFLVCTARVGQGVSLGIERSVPRATCLRSVGRLFPAACRSSSTSSTCDGSKEPRLPCSRGRKPSAELRW